MGISFIQAGTLALIKGAEYRFKRKISETNWQLEDTRTKRIIELERDCLERMYLAGEFIFTRPAEVEVSSARMADLPAAEWEKMKVRRSYVIAAMEVSNSKEVLEPVISKVWDGLNQPDHRPCRKTVIAWTKRYQDSGNDIYALRERTDRKGNRKERFPKEVESISLNSVDAIYMVQPRKTIKDTTDHAVTMVKRENRLRPAKGALPLPTYKYISNLISKIPEMDKYAARHGAEAARVRYRYVGGGHVVNAPLDRGEIDHSLLDIFVIDDRTYLPLGRPYLTCCVDIFSRCILGFYIGFTPPSFYSTACCLKHALMPKNNLKEIYPSIENDWLAYGVVTELGVDNGSENHGLSFDKFCMSLGTQIEYSPRKSPWHKGTIERFFGTIERGLLHGIPGAALSIIERGDYDPAKHAVVTFSTLLEVMHKWVADVYHQDFHSSIGMTPAQKWTSSISPDHIRMAADPCLLDVIAGTCDTRTHTHKGIEMLSLRFNCPELHELGCRFGFNTKVDIRIDEGNIGHLFVIHPQAPKPILVPAVRPDYAEGITFWQHKVIRRYRLTHTALPDNPDGWLEAKAQIAEIIERDFALKRRASRKRTARYLNGAKKAEKLAAPPERELPSPPAEASGMSTPETELTLYKPIILKKGK